MVTAHARFELGRGGVDGCNQLPEEVRREAGLKNAVRSLIGHTGRQSRTMMLLLRKAHLGAVSVSVWPPVLKNMCLRRNIRVLE